MRIVLLVADSLRADAQRPQGGLCVTPTLDRLAREGVSFETALTCASWTVPSIAAMATGVYGHRLGLYRWQQPIPDRHPTVFRLLADAGYRVASFVFDEKQLLSSVPEACVEGSSQRLDGVVDWLERCEEGDLFLFIHYWGTHFPYLDKPMTNAAWKKVSDSVIDAMNADPEAVRPKVRMLYARSVERLSEIFIPRLLGALLRRGGRSGCCLAVTSDHGESWGERLPPGAALKNVFDLHGNRLYEETLRVPLIFWGPPWLKKGSAGGLARTVDIAPTLLEAAGVRGFPVEEGEQGKEGGEGIDGISLLPCLTAGEPACAPSAIAARSADFITVRETPQDPSKLWLQLALRTRRWKYLWSPAADERILHDLQDDPGELRPLLPGSGEPPDGWETLRTEFRRSRCATPVDAAARRLEKLGYIE
jgi:arylsulfatase A-like enzyme